MTDFDRDGVAAEFSVIPTVELVAKPASRSHVESAAIPLAALSAYQGLVDHGGISRNQTVLIHGGAEELELCRSDRPGFGAYVMARASGPRPPGREHRWRQDRSCHRIRDGSGCARLSR